MRIATWNINSVRLRISQVIKFIQEQKIDVICLQETKTLDEYFPSDEFKNNGYDYQYYRGEKSYNGVAIISNTKLTDTNYINFCEKGDARHIFVKFKNDVELHNFYVPAGGDEPDININLKFEHKISFLNEMKENLSKDKKTKKVLVGDLNIAPLEHDVWSHKQLLNVVSHTKIETDTLLEIIITGGWVDVMRTLVPHDEKLYSWWSYRNKDWMKSNRGRRLDHILVSKDLENHINEIKIHKEIRGIDKPSD